MIDIHVDGSVYFGKNNNGRPVKVGGYGFLVYDGFDIVHFENGELVADNKKPWLLLRHFETMSAEIAIAWVKTHFPGQLFRVFTDSHTAAHDINKQYGLAATVVTKEYSGYLFINNLRAHTLALSASRKSAYEKNVAMPKKTSKLTFADRFKQWLPEYRRKAIAI